MVNVCDSGKKLNDNISIHAIIPVTQFIDYKEKNFTYVAHLIPYKVVQKYLVV